MKSYDVAIVGMGPVGATLACLLARRGLQVLVVDRELAIYDKPRAIVLDHEALRVLQHCGVEESFFQSVFPHTGTDFVGIDGQLIKLFDPKAPPFELGWPPNVMFIQPELEEALARAMDRCATIERHRGISVTGADDQGDKVILTLSEIDGAERQVEAAWVVGADGANSFIRESAGLPLHDMDFAEWWIVVDAWLTGDTPLPRKTTQYCQPKRPATFVVGPRGLLRWEIKLLPGEDPQEMRSDDRINELLSGFVDPAAVSLWRSAVYRFRAAVADRWREGRLLIAGDAAHTMPPFLAQGLCAGIRDAASLAWRLDQVLRHDANDALLDSYEIERKPHVAEIIGHAKAFGLIIGELDPQRAAERDRVLEEQLRSGTVPTERQAFVPMLREGVIAAGDPLAGTLFVQPKVLTGTPAREQLLDDLVGPDFLIVSDDAAMLDLPPSLLQRWEAIGGQRLFVGTGPAAEGVTRLNDTEGLIARWLARSNIKAAIVRPDRYVYGGASDPSALRQSVMDLTAQLTGSETYAAA
ncbi:3-(3-hydroxy-phenyl)propionate hydroxylase [Novosphingobium chloroacetimidivorans]|uniref:3-(3-hydroxy-phenyl)propionate hydroxylase n=1 Tax=Novosphingobium chloroacetimidivorans TaxID=1428314 RepID=A0A7W7KA05_9SPHN|nr:bifunctional 3-(3-hydroxy-phenyl)propionate/3-hydroxycinnamic acid hydroxylase [Novosphingobium chloroacetimidivorans]MBB4858676.1 3-(3-hydroxy-phenyl)propionate hydroxylase [Novosphingobium chloroacetimidivorans]